MFSAVFRCFPTVFRLFSDYVFRLLKSSSSWSKLSMMGPQLFSGWYQKVLDVSRCFLTVFRQCFPTVEILFKLNWIIFDGSSVVLRMISDDFRCFPMFSAVFRCFPTVFRCSQLFSDVFSWVVTFMDNHPLCRHFSQDALNWSQIFFRDSQMCLRCAQMFSDVHRCFQMITDVFGFSLDIQ